MAKEKWYRTGAVAEETGISQFRLRALAKEGLIESRANSGMIYIPAREVQRLKENGPPVMPARVDMSESDAGDDGDDDGDSDRVEAPPATRRLVPAPAPTNRLTQELYAEPSRELARSKEQVIKLGHALEAKRLQQQSREIDRADKEEWARHYEKKRLQEWRDGNIRRVVEKVPGESCAETCARVEELLNRVPPGSNVTAKVDQIIEIALRPTRRREDQARAVEQAVLQLRSGARREWEDRARSEALNAILQLPEHAGYADMHSAARAIVDALNAAFDHAGRIEHEVSWLGLSLPSGWSSDDLEEARYLARKALRGLSPSTSDRQFKSTLQTAIAPVASRVESKQAQEERNRQERSHRSRIDSKVSYVYLSSGATSEECETARRRVRGALEQLPPNASDWEVETETERQLAPIKAAIRAREEATRKADSALSALEQYLREFFDFDSEYDVYTATRELKEWMRPRLIKMIQSGKLINTAHIERWVKEQVEAS